MLRAKVPALGNTPVKSPIAGEARPLGQSDVSGVAELFQKTFRSPRQPAPASLRDYLEQIFLNHPWQDKDQTSRVIVDGEGAVSGFIGVLPQRLQHGEAVIRASVLGSLMSNEPQRNPLVGARLLRAALRGNHDIAFSESANPLSLKMWETSGGVTLPLHSLSWMRIFRPAALPFSMVAERFPFTSKIVPLTAGLDRLVRRIAPGTFSVADMDGPPGDDFEVGADEFAAAIPALCARYAIRPVWDGEILGWLLQQASTKARFGSVTMRLVKSKGGRILGGYIYYGKPGGIAFALQLFAEPNAERLIVDSLLSRAAGRGFAAVWGRVQPEFLDALARRHSIVFRRSATVVHTRKADLLAALLAGNALITGLAAEAWARLIGDEF